MALAFGKIPLTLEAYVLNSEELLFLFLHNLLLRNGFICIYEIPSSVPGFAPSLKELPLNRLVPDGWNARNDGGAIVSNFKLKSQTVKKFTLQSRSVSSDRHAVELKLTELQSGLHSSIQIDTSKYISASLLTSATCNHSQQATVSACGLTSVDGATVQWSDVFVDEDALTALLTDQLLGPLGVAAATPEPTLDPTLQPATLPARSGMQTHYVPPIVHSTQTARTVDAPKLAYAPAAQPPSMVNIPPVAAAASSNEATAAFAAADPYFRANPTITNIPPSVVPVGAADAFPFPNLLVPPSHPWSPGGVFPAGAIHPNVSSEPGGLVGPNHPIFGGDPSSLYAPGGYLPHLPQPRYDPIYPDLPDLAGNDIFGPQGIPGRGGGRGGRGGRGPAGRGSQSLHPDLFQPPNFGDFDGSNRFI